MYFALLRQSLHEDMHTLSLMVFNSLPLRILGKTARIDSASCAVLSVVDLLKPIAMR